MKWGAGGVQLARAREKHQDFRRATQLSKMMRPGQIADRRVPSKQWDEWRRNYKNDKKKLATFHLYFYAINKDGANGAASLWRNGYEANKQAAYAVHDGTEIAAGALHTFL